MAILKSLYRQSRARWDRTTATQAIATARRHIAGTLAEYESKLAAWKAAPDKRRYAAGGSANRPAFPSLYTRCAHDDAVPDGYQLFAFMGDRGRVSDSPDYGYYSDTWQDATFYPCVLVRRTAKKHVWACVPAYFDSMAEEYIFTDRNPRETATSAELFENDGCKITDADSVDTAMTTAKRLAERSAERARADDEKWQAASAENDKRDEARDELQAARLDASQTIAALREQRALGVAPMVCQMLQARVTQARDDMHDAIKAIEAATDAIADLDMQGAF